MPIGVYTGLAITGSCVRDVVTDPDAQVAAVLALHERFHAPLMLTAMDLSAEAEIFGCEVRMADDEIPTVIGRRATTDSEIEALSVPAPGDGRTCVHLETARKLVSASHSVPVIGGLIGPFSLAARIFGVSETLEGTLSQPELVLSLLEKATSFLAEYAMAFRAAGAAGVIMAEPAAGLLSPRSLAKFSSSFVKQIVTATQNENFAIILHNCAAKLAHLPKVIESGAEIYHFGAPMDLPAALQQVKGKVILCGNLDPTHIVHDGTPETIRAEAMRLLQAAAGNPAFVLSSGCDLPPGTRLENVEVFYQVVHTALPV